MKHTVIYVLGILDNEHHIQQILLQFWRLRGVNPVVHAMPWLGAEVYEPKLNRLLQVIDTYVAKGDTVSLVGTSAGASAVLNAYIRRRDNISGIGFICGKIHRPEIVSENLYAQNPAFKTSMLELQKILPELTVTDKEKMLSLYSPTDASVPYPDSVIDGVKERRLPNLRHGYAIVYALFFEAGTIIHHLKLMAKKNNRESGALT